MAVKLQELKKESPGVPANTCPYIDEVIRIVHELQDSYDNLAATGVAEPLFDERCQIVVNSLEYVRHANETLRDNSYYWYNKFKLTMNKKRK